MRDIPNKQNNFKISLQNLIQSKFRQFLQHDRLTACFKSCGITPIGLQSYWREGTKKCARSAKAAQRDSKTDKGT